jgi:putative MATE family efflux protein
MDKHVGYSEHGTTAIEKQGDAPSEKGAKAASIVAEDDGAEASATAVSDAGAETVVAAAPDAEGSGADSSSKSHHSHSRNIDILNGPIPSRLLLFAIPLALSSILQQLLSSTDASVAGRFVSGQALAGIGATSPVTSMFVSLFVGVSVGANVAMAVSIGLKERDRSVDATHTSFGLSIVMGVGLAIVGILSAGWLVSVLGMPADSADESRTYLEVYFVGLPFLTIYNFGAALMRAHGDVRKPLIALLAAAIANLLLDLLFACVFGWGTVGIAAATDISFAISAGMVVFWLSRDEEPFRLHLHQITLRGATLRTILRIGIPAGLQGAIFSLSNVVVQSAIDGFGWEAIGGSSACMNLEAYTYFFVNAFAQAAVTFIGQNYAARRYDRCRKVVRWCMLFAIVSALILSVTFTVADNQVLSIFTTDAVALQYGIVRVWRVELLEPLTSLYEVPGGAMRGMGWSTLPAVITIIGSCVLRVIYVVALFPLSGRYEDLMTLYPATWLMMGVAMIIAYQIVSRRAFSKGKPRGTSGGSTRGTSGGSTRGTSNGSTPVPGTKMPKRPVTA